MAQDKIINKINNLSLELESLNGAQSASWAFSVPDLAPRGAWPISAEPTTKTQSPVERGAYFLNFGFGEVSKGIYLEEFQNKEGQVGQKQVFLLSGLSS